MTNSKNPAAHDNPNRVSILGVGVHALNPALALALIESRVRSGKKGYVCVTGVHGIMEAQSDPAFKTILNESFLTTPDGMPTVWIGQSQGHTQMKRVYGPDLMLSVCQASVTSGFTHFLYGGQEGVAELLKKTLEAKFPGIRVVGTYTPPFRPLSADEQTSLAAEFSRSKPDYVWVGLSTPKQERFMSEYLPKLETKVMFGVGAAFDILTGRIQDAPAWVKRIGMQWFHRMLQDPKRLAPRYLSVNPRFVATYLASRLFKETPK